MKIRLYNNLLLFSLFGIALWFFGNLYEGIVITLNLLKNPVQKIQDWQDFFEITNPLFYYIPFAPLAIFTSVFLYVKTARDKLVLKKHLKLVTIWGLSAFGLGIVIITQINVKLFFGDIRTYYEDAYSLSVLWNILNVVRVAFLTVTLIHLFKAYIWTQKADMTFDL